MGREGVGGHPPRSPGKRLPPPAPPPASSHPPWFPSSRPRQAGPYAPGSGGGLAQTLARPAAHPSGLLRLSIKRERGTGLGTPPLPPGKRLPPPAPPPAPAYPLIGRATPRPGPRARRCEEPRRAIFCPARPRDLRSAGPFSRGVARLRLRRPSADYAPLQSAATQGFPYFRPAGQKVTHSSLTFSVPIALYCTDALCVGSLDVCRSTLRQRDQKGERRGLPERNRPKAPRRRSAISAEDDAEADKVRSALGQDKKQAKDGRQTANPRKHLRKQGGKHH
jgi:hypothetical protein